MSSFENVVDLNHQLCVSTKAHYIYYSTTFYQQFEPNYWNVFTKNLT